MITTNVWQSQCCVRHAETSILTVMQDNCLGRHLLHVCTRQCNLFIVPLARLHHVKHSRVDLRPHLLCLANLFRLVRFQVCNMSKLHVSPSNVGFCHGHKLKYILGECQRDQL